MYFAAAGSSEGGGGSLLGATDACVFVSHDVRIFPQHHLPAFDKILHPMGSLVAQCDQHFGTREVWLSVPDASGTFFPFLLISIL